MTARTFDATGVRAIVIENLVKVDLATMKRL